MEPVHWFEPLESWIISQYDDCRRILTDYRGFAADADAPGIQSLDPPVSLPYRSLVRTGLRAAETIEFRSLMAKRARELLLGLSGKESFDVMREFIGPFALAVLCDLIGVPAPQFNEFDHDATALQRAMDGGLRPEVISPAVEARARISKVISVWFADHEPGLLGHVLNGANNIQVDMESVHDTVRFIIFSTYGTGTAALGNAVVALLQQPSRLRGLSAIPADQWHTACDELLRYDGPVQVTARRCAAQTTVGSQTIAVGDNLILLLGSANRDGRQFEEPDSLDLYRAPNPHFALGWGAHVCLGANLTLSMMETALRALLENVPDLILEDLPRRKGISTSRAFAAIPVRRGGMPPAPYDVPFATHPSKG